MMQWLTPNVAIVLMLVGVLPSLLAIALLYDKRDVPGVIWFLISMGTGIAWALVFSLMTLIPSRAVTFGLANIFWSIIPVVTVSLFLLAYEFVHKTTIKHRYAALLFVPIGVFFALSWVNPWNIVYTAEYTVTTDGFLSFPRIGGVLRLAVIQVYSFLLMILAASMFVGEAIRTDGVHRQQTLYLLVIFSALIVSTLIKIAGIMPIYYDVTSTIYGFSGLFFAYSIDQHGFLRYIPTARDATFDEMDDAIIVINEDDEIIDTNQKTQQLFNTNITDQNVNDWLPDYATPNGNATQIELLVHNELHNFSVRHSNVDYGRGLTATIITLSDVTQLKKQKQELQLLKEILSRMFRHNVRSQLTVIMGYTKQIEKRGSPEITEIANDIADISKHIEAQTEKAGKIENVISDNECVEKPLQDFINPEDFALINNYENATISLDISNVSVKAHPALNIAVQEVVKNAIIHNSTDRAPTVDIYTERTKDNLSLVIEDNGPGIPQHEINVLENKKETNLSHSSGIGLWLIQWIVNYSNAKLLTEISETGTAIKIHLNHGDTANT